MILNEYDERDKEIERLYKDVERLSELLSTSERRVSHLEQQLKEANEVVLLANCVVDAYDEIDKYLEKWGLK